MTFDVAWLHDTLQELRRHRGDTTSIEVKRASGGLPQNLPTTICAFANMPGGGVILLGVDEKAGFRITGVDDPASIEAGVVSQARNAVDPPPFVEVQTLDVNDQAVVIAQVSGLSLADKPARYFGRAYLRQADGDYVMGDHEIKMIEVAKLLSDQSEEADARAVSDTSKQDLASDLVETFLESFKQARMRRQSGRVASLSDEQILKLSGVTKADGVLSLASLYAMGQFPQGLVPSLAVDAAVRLPRVHGRGLKNKETFNGPIPDMLDDVMSWMEENLAVIRRYGNDGNMYDSFEIPLPAIRELVANALVHRDLSPNTIGYGKLIHIRLTPDRLFIQSPGGLRGVTVKQIESTDHAQAWVNPILYALLKELKTQDGAAIIEGEGGGIQAVKSLCQDAGLDQPRFIDTGVQFTAIIYRGQDSNQLQDDHPIYDELESEPESGDIRAVSANQSDQPLTDTTNALIAATTKNGAVIAEAFKKMPTLSLQSAIDATGLSAGQVRHALSVLRDAGLVRMTGGQGERATRYTLV